MQNTIKDLWYGNITPLEDINVTPKLNSLYSALNKIKLELRPIIENKWDKIDDLYADIINEYQLDAFIQGFSLGVKLISNVYLDK